MSRMSKKIVTFFLFLSLGGDMLYAGPSNYVSIADIKDALYYLIKDYQKLLKSSKNNKKRIEQLKIEMNKEFKQIKLTIKNRNIKVDNELQKLFDEVKLLNKKLDSLKSRAILIPNKEDKYDRYIAGFVEENEDTLKKIQ